MGPVFAKCEAATVFRPQRILARTFVMATARRLLWEREQFEGATHQGLIRSKNSFPTRRGLDGPFIDLGI